MLRVDELRRQPGSRVLTLAVAGFAGLWTALRIPGPALLLFDHDLGHQLAGGSQVLGGEHPFLDFRSVYGPLVFYASAAAQRLAGGRALGEFALEALALAVAYAWLFRLAWCAAGPGKRGRGVGLAVGGLAAIAAPVPWIYYAVLGPVATLGLAWRYLESPGPARLAALALAVAATGLFRHDFGAYAALCAGTAVLARPAPSARARLARGAGLAAAVALAASPWLLFAALHGALDDYLLDTLVGGARMATGFSKPFPRFDADGPLASPANAEFLAFRLCHAVPLLALGVAVARRRRMDRLERCRIACALLLAQCTLVQAVHRPGFPHLLQAIPASFVLWAWLGGIAAEAWGRGQARGRLAAAAGLAAALLCGAALVHAASATVGRVVSGPVGALRTLQIYAGPREGILAAAGAGEVETRLVSAIRFVRRCTPPERPILALPRLMSFVYLSGRPFGGGQMAIAPGFFTTAEDQQRMMDRILRQGVAVLVDLPYHRYDERPDGTARDYAPRLHEFLRRRFTPVRRFGEGLWVRVDRERLPGLSRERPGCYGAPRE